MTTYYYITRNELSHAGVKGMKWGVRRAQKKAARAERRANMTPEEKKRSKVKKGLIIGGSVAAAGALAAIGGVAIKKYTGSSNRDAVMIGEKVVKTYKSGALYREIPITEVARTQVSRTQVARTLIRR